MKQGMWRCSGQHWLTAAFCWSLAVLVVGIVADVSAGEPQDNQPAAAVNAELHLGRLDFAGSLGVAMQHAAPVSIEFKGLDLAELDSVHFGDSDELALSAIVADKNK